MKQTLNSLRNAVISHKTELGAFGAGSICGALLTYVSIHRGIKKFLNGVTKFINE